MHSPKKRMNTMSMAASDELPITILVNLPLQLHYYSSYYYNGYWIEVLWDAFSISVVAVTGVSDVDSSIVSNRMMK